MFYSANASFLLLGTSVRKDFSDDKKEAFEAKVY